MTKAVGAFPGRHRLATAGLLPLAVSFVACGTGEQAMAPPGPEAEFYSRLYQLSRACESLDVERISTFYAADASSSTPGQRFRDDRGLAAIRATASSHLTRVRTIKITLTDVVQVRGGSGRVTTTQGFRAEWTTKDGSEVTWEGRHSAVWENRSGAFLIAHEELLGTPVVKGAPGLVLPALRGVAPPVPAATPEPAPSPPPDPAATPAPAVVEIPPVRPEPVRVAPVATPAATAETAAAPASTTAPAAPDAPARPGPRSAQNAGRGSETVPAQARAAAFTTPDWTGTPVFVIHFGSFTDRKRAEAHAAILGRQTKLPAHAVRVDLGAKGTWVRSVVGEFGSVEEALATRNRLATEGVEGMGLVYRMTAGGR